MKKSLSLIAVICALTMTAACGHDNTSSDVKGSTSASSSTAAESSEAERYRILLPLPLFRRPPLSQHPLLFRQQVSQKLPPNHPKAQKMTSHTSLLDTTLQEAITVPNSAKLKMMTEKLSRYISMTSSTVTQAPAIGITLIRIHSKVQIYWTMKSTSLKQLPLSGCRMFRSEVN